MAPGASLRLVLRAQALVELPQFVEQLKAQPPIGQRAVGQSFEVPIDVPGEYLLELVDDQNDCELPGREAAPHHGQGMLEEVDEVGRRRLQLPDRSRRYAAHGADWRHPFKSPSFVSRVIVGNSGLTARTNRLNRPTASGAKKARDEQIGATRVLIPTGPGGIREHRIKRVRLREFRRTGSVYINFTGWAIVPAGAGGSGPRTRFEYPVERARLDLGSRDDAAQDSGADRPYRVVLQKCPYREVSGSNSRNGMTQTTQQRRLPRPRGSIAATTGREDQRGHLLGFALAPKKRLEILDLIAFTSFVRFQVHVWNSSRWCSGRVAEPSSVPRNAAGGWSTTMIPVRFRICCTRLFHTRSSISS